MSGFFKRRQPFKTQTKIAYFNGFGTGFDYKKGRLTASDCNNCDCDDGRLKNGLGIQAFETQLGIAEQVFIFDACDGTETILGTFENGEFYQFNENPPMPFGFHYRQNFYAKMKPMRVFTEDKTAKLIAVGEKGLYLHDRAQRLFVPTEMITPIRHAVFWQNRLFCALDNCEIVYSAPGDPLDFTRSVENGGSILFPCERGEIVGLETLKGDLYIFYEYGIAKLKTAGSPREFVWEFVGYHGGKIVSSSACCCGEDIFFLATDGAYTFNGKTAEKTGKGLALSPTDDGKCACAVADGYYYALYYDKLLGKKAVAINCESGEAFFFFTTESMAFWQGQVFVYYNGQSGVLRKGEIPPSDGSAYFTAKETDFSHRGYKRIKRLTLYGTAHCEMILSSGGNSESFEVRFQGKADFSPSLRGEKFQLTIKPIGVCDLHALEVETVALKR